MCLTPQFCVRWSLQIILSLSKIKGKKLFALGTKLVSFRDILVSKRLISSAKFIQIWVWQGKKRCVQGVPAILLRMCQQRM